MTAGPRLLKPLRHFAGVNLHRFRQAFVYPRQVRKEMEAFKTNGPRVKGNALRIVVLNHAYDQDLQAICEAASLGHETIWELSPSVFHKSIHEYLSPRFCDLYHSNESPEQAPAIQRYTEEFVRPFVEFLIATTHLDLLLTPSDQFFWFRPVISVLREKGIPVVVQDKEGTTCRTVVDTLAPLLKNNFPPISDRYVYWNETSRAYGNLSGVAPALQTVIGQPRSDYFFMPKRWASRKELGLPEKSKIILFFTFCDDVYTREGLTHPGTIHPWLELRRDINKVLSGILQKHPDAYLVIKAHPQQPDLKDNRREIKRLIKSKRHVFLTGAASSNQLIVNADVIVGFQSTALLEALTTQKPVIYAGWGKELEKLTSDLIPISDSKACVIADSPESLKNALERLLQTATPLKETEQTHRKAFIDRFFYSANGLASRRLLNYLVSLKKA